MEKEKIDITGFCYFNAEDLKSALYNTRNYIFSLIERLPMDEPLEAGALSQALFPLNILIDEVEYIDNKNKDEL